MRHKISFGKNVSQAKGIVWGITITVITLIAGLALISAFLINGNIHQLLSEKLSLALLVMAIFSGIHVTNKIVGEHFIINAAIEGGIAYVLLIGSHIVFFKGTFCGIATILICVMLGMVCAILSIIPGKEKKRKRRNR